MGVLLILRMVRTLISVSFLPHCPELCVRLEMCTPNLIYLCKHALVWVISSLRHIDKRRYVDLVTFDL